MFLWNNNIAASFSMKIFIKKKETHCLNVVDFAHSSCTQILNFEWNTQNTVYDARCTFVF